MERVKLEPQIVFDCFKEVNRIPRPSKKEERMITFLKDFGEKLGLETKVDEAGNVAIKKPATPGYEQLKPCIIQSHMDMVCEKRADVSFDFMADAIETEIDGEWMRAKGTTLGADDGIGVAMEMALLRSDDIAHGPIQCVFTRDEETGLTGASGMKAGFMEGDYLLNLDSEDEGQIFISCAGGARTGATFRFEPEQLEPDDYCFDITVSGLIGGHSGDDIDKKRANANKLLFRFLYSQIEKGRYLRIIDVQSGGLHNAIPRDGHVVCAMKNADRDALVADLNLYRSDIEEEYHKSDPGIKIELSSHEVAQSALPQSVSNRLIMAVQAVYNGVLAMSQDLDTLVETSSNLASVRREGNTIVLNSSQRSSVGSARLNMSAIVRAAFRLAGAEVETNEGYPGWKMNPNSEILKVAVESYKRLFKKEPQVKAIHAGLECGLFSEKYPNLDMISFGPTLRGVHSPDEKLLIPTVKMVWDHLLDILVHIPAK